MNTSDKGWRRISSRAAFLESIADRTLSGDGMRFVIHSNGDVSGQVAGEQLSGHWYWEDGYFCRTAMLKDESLGLDCEVIELRGDNMRYTRNKGLGAASIVTIGDRLPSER